MKVNLDGLKFVWSDMRYAIYEYKPSLFHLYYVDFERMPFVRRIRLTLEYLQRNHYRVYYLAVEGELVGHCLVAPGGRRLRCSTNNDIVLGPYFIELQHRGNGYSEILVEGVLKNYMDNYQYAFDYIKKSNVPSIKTSKNCGFKKIGELDKIGIFHTLTEVNNGEYEIYRYTNGNSELKVR